MNKSSDGRLGAGWSIVTVTHNSADDLRTWWKPRGTNDPPWIVVDNNSADETVKIARELGARVLQLDKNLGFSKANNLGFQSAETEYVAFVNPDVELRVEDLAPIQRTIDTFHAIVAPQLLNPDGSSQPNGRGLPFLVDKFANRGLKIPGSRLQEYLPVIGDEPESVAWLTGAAVCGARSDLQALGPWDERFFLYYEDQELSLAAWQNGLRVMIDPTVRWVHGWHRATKSFRMSPWLREIASSIRFYRKRPIFLTLARKRAAEEYGLFKSNEKAASDNQGLHTIKNPAAE